MIFHWSLTNRYSPLVSRTLLSILNNAVAFMVSIRPLIFPFFQSPFQVFKNHSKGAKYNLYHRQPHVSQSS